jgi:protein O-GlcNAc transferase
MNQIQLLQQGAAHLQAGRAAEAERLFREVLRDDPANGPANSVMGTMRLQQDRAADALPFFTAALARQPDPGTLMNYGLALDRIGRRTEAVDAFDRALAFNPGFFAAHYNRGNALLVLERLEEAVAAFDQALVLDPGFAGAHFNRAEALRRLERFAPALSALAQAAALSPRDVAIANSQGIVLRRLDRLDEARAAYGRALALDPNHADALYNRAGLLRQIGLRDDAIADLGRLVMLQPANADAQLMRAALLFERRRLDEARAAFEAYAKLRPDDPVGVGGIAATASELCDWDELAAVDARVDDGLRNGTLAMPMQGLMAMRDDPALLLKAAQNAVAEWVPAPLPPPLWRGTAYRHDRIRLTYVSSDFRPHPMSLVLLELIERHDRTRFEVTGIAMGPDDSSPIRARWAAAFDHFIPVLDHDQQRAARLVRELETDIALDCTGHTADNLLRIFGQRPAPVQVNYLGFPGTLGGGFMDYIIGDPTVLPFSRQPFFTEQIVHMPDCYMLNDTKGRPCARIPDRAEAGLPPTGFVFACFNYSWKMKAPVFDVWMRLLQAVPGSILWLKEIAPQVTANLQAQAARRGVDPARLVFAPGLPSFDQHMARLHLADLFLDTLPYNAHVTGCDALWAGLPVLTCQGESFASRVGASLLKAAGLPELITSSLADYEALGLALARDPALLDGYRQRLTANRDSCALFDTDRYRRGIEAAFEHMWEIAQRGGPPESFAVADLPGQS